MTKFHFKDPDGKRLLKKFSEPRNPTKTDPRLRIKPEDDPADFAKLLDYNAQDVRAEAQISELTPDLSETELQIWLTDQRINQRGIAVDMAGVENCIAIVEQAHAKYNAELYRLTNGAVAEASEIAKLTQWMGTQGIYTGGLDEETVQHWLDKPDIPAGVRRALQIRQALGSASVKKLFAFRAQSCNGRLYDLYSYFAARTGRWTGNGPQPQNLPKGEFHTIEEVERALALIAFRSLELVEAVYGDALNCIVNCLRGLLVAGPGCELLCSDYSAIEGVVTAALAGEEWRLEVFRTHGMIYEASASLITGIPFEDFVNHRLQSGGVRQLDQTIVGGKHHPQRALIGKFAELASGFGGWVGAWKNFGADKHLDDYQIKQAILGWRAASPMVVELWGGQFRGPFGSEYHCLHGLEGCAVAAVQNPGQCYSYRGISYQTAGDVLYCQVPDGGLISYHAPRLSPSEREYARPGELSLTYEGWNSNPKAGAIGWTRMYLYGGKMTENVVQKVARSWMAGALVRLDPIYPIVMHSHDEPVAEVPIGFGSIEHFESLMSIPPHPCYAGWPIKAKGGWRGPRYGKFE